MIRPRGLSLVELMVCLALLGLVVTFVITLVPSSAIGLQKAADVEAAACYATEALDDARLRAVAIVAAPPTPGPSFVDLDTTVHLDRSNFTVTRTWLQVASEPAPDPAPTTLWDVSVTMQEPRGAHFTLTTRIDAVAP